VAGKTLYASSCAMCHGADPSKGTSNIANAKSASNILSAISSNKGGMSFLGATIGSTEAANIAAYVTKPF
jgi:mono/diheme cytochrome c family protein